MLTPHAGELASLLAARGLAVERADVEAEPLRWAREAQRLTGAAVLLKGPVTIVVGTRGVLSQADGTPWLATAGAGDVLAGVLGALIAGVAAEAPGSRLSPTATSRAPRMRRIDPRPGSSGRLGGRTCDGVASRAGPAGGDRRAARGVTDARP